MSTSQKPQVIVLNGGSSSGKTLLARALQENLPGTWLTFGVDTFIDALPAGGDSQRAGIAFEPGGTITFNAEYRALENSWYAGLRGMVRAGAHLILDEVLLSGGAGQKRLRLAFGGVELVWVAVRCDPDVAEARETQRLDRVAGMARQQSLSVHSGVVYDVEVDTTHDSAQRCARDIVRQLSLGPNAR